MVCARARIWASISSLSRREIGTVVKVSRNSWRMSTISTLASGRPAILSFSVASSYLRWLAFQQDSSDGVAEPKRASACASRARTTATSLPW